jgi:hypothetical protein
MATQELAQGNTQGAGEAPQTQQEIKIKYEIGVTWNFRRLNVKAKVIEGEDRWNASNVMYAVAQLLNKWRTPIPNIRGNRLVPSWLHSLVDSHKCEGTLTIILRQYKEGLLNLTDEIYTEKIGKEEKWFVANVETDIDCMTNKYVHTINLVFSHQTIIDKYTHECKDSCVEHSLPSQAKINKLYEMLITLSDALPLAGWYTGKMLVSEDD